MAAEKQEPPAVEQARVSKGALSRRQQLLVWVLLAGLPLSGLLGWVAAMNSQAMQDHQRLREERAGIHAELEDTRLRHKQLEVDLLVARQSLVDGQALIADLEQQLFRQQQDLAQYQGSLVPNALAPGVRIQAFELVGTEVPGVYRYKIMISRVGNESEMLEASLQLTLQGTQEGEVVQLSLAELSDGRTESLPLSFRYFQVVPGSDDAELMLPQGFDPQQIQLMVEQDGKVLLEQVMEWTETGVRF